MLIRQLEVSLNNRVGELEKVVSELGKAGIDIKALTLSDGRDNSIARIIVSDTDSAVKLLEKNGTKVKGNEVVIVEIPDRPGGLSQILTSLKKAQINVEYIYAFMSKLEGKALAVCGFDDNRQACEALKKEGFILIADHRIQEEEEGLLETNDFRDYTGGYIPQ